MVLRHEEYLRIFYGQNIEDEEPPPIVDVEEIAIVCGYSPVYPYEHYGTAVFNPDGGPDIDIRAEEKSIPGTYIVFTSAEGELQIAALEATFNDAKAANPDAQIGSKDFRIFAQSTRGTLVIIAPEEVLDKYEDWSGGLVRQDAGRKPLADEKYAHTWAATPFHQLIAQRFSFQPDTGTGKAKN